MSRDIKIQEYFVTHRPLSWLFYPMVDLCTSDSARQLYARTMKGRQCWSTAFWGIIFIIAFMTRHRSWLLSLNFHSRSVLYLFKDACCFCNKKWQQRCSSFCWIWFSRYLHRSGMNTCYLSLYIVILAFSETIDLFNSSAKWIDKWCFVY